jgi:CheY-like chemotaxis protein
VEAVRPSSPVVLPRSRILIVDDEPLVARAMARALGRDDIVMAGDGQRALDLCRAGTFDLILCDVMMPRMDGPAFFVALSAERPELVRRVVFMSGGAFAPAAAAFLERVPNPKLDKPVDVGRLLAVARPIVLARASVPPSGTWSAPPP